MRSWAAMVSASVLLATTSAGAYDIRTRIEVAGFDLFYLQDVHESITALAEACLANSRGARPAGCWSDASVLANMSTSEDGEQYSHMQLASRWPDDPTRQSALVTFPKLGVNLQSGCQERIAQGSALEYAGLLCTSHFGRAQFMHAMASIGDASPAQTHDRITTWARFAFRVATGAQDLNEPYCTAMDRQPEALRSALQMTDRTFCTNRQGLWRSYGPWTVRTFFTFTCGNPVSSRRCSEQRPGPEGDQIARQAAAGALLHLVQDSFSQAHAARWTRVPVTVRGPFTNQVVCVYPMGYFNYADQLRELHTTADKPPARDPSCDDDPRTPRPNDPQTDDVVTASAVVLWSISQGQGQEDAFLSYISERVFGPRPGA